MAHQRHLAHQEGIRFFFNPEAPQRGDRVFLHATVFDKDSFPIRGGKVRATITAESGAGERLDLNAEPGGWGVFTGSFTAREGGRHKIAIACEEAGREVSAEMLVQSPRRELAGRPARSDVMREIAGISGGRCGAMDDLREMVRSIELLPQAKPVEERLRIWCHWLWATLIIMLFGSYWIGRKFVGMI